MYYAKLSKNLSAVHDTIKKKFFNGNSVGNIHIFNHVNATRHLRNKVGTFRGASTRKNFFA